MNELAKSCESYDISLIRDIYRDQIERSTNWIHQDLQNIACNFCKLGFHLWELKYSGFRCYKKERTVNDTNFYNYINEIFGISKTTCNNYIRVCELFSHGENMHIYLDAKYKDFSLSQLVEMSSLPPNMWGKVKPNMTVKQIRALKQLPDNERTDPISGREHNKVSVRETFVNVYRMHTAHNLEDDLLKCLKLSSKNEDRVQHLVMLFNDFWQLYGD